MNKRENMGSRLNLLSADRASEQTRRFKCIENLRRARNDRNRSRRLHLHSDLDAIRRRDSFVASIVAGRMKLGGIVSSLMERVSLRHFNVGGKCCEGSSSSSYFFPFFFFFSFFSSEMFHKLAGHPSHREMPSRLKDIYLLANDRQIFFFFFNISWEHEKDTSIRQMTIYISRN